MLEKLNEKSIDVLVNAILSLNTKEECYAFLEDIMTIAEVKAMAQRLEVAKMLKEKVVYTDIVKKTGASTTTISRVNKSLNYGAGGYEDVLKKLKLIDDGEK